MTLPSGSVPVLREFADFRGFDPIAEVFANAQRWLWTQGRTSVMAENVAICVGENWSTQSGS
eukprot:10726034-Karenia_brevis.AAC.1